MTKKFFTFIVLLMFVLSAFAQTISKVPVMTPAGGVYNDNVTLTCTFPEGCAGGKYWINGAEITASNYDSPLFIDYSCKVSIAGVNAEGRIITDVVTNDYTINRVTPPYTTTTPSEGVRDTSFYATSIKWNNVTTSSLNLNDFKEGGKRREENVIWITDESGKTITTGDYNSIWANGKNQYKAYFYKNYDIKTPGKYILHVTKGVFVLDGKVYDKELQLNYEIAAPITAPAFSPKEGEYVAPLTVTISYPTDGSAVYQFYRLNGGKATSYTKPLVITESATIEAYGLSEDFSTQTATTKATYTLVAPEPEPECLDAPVLTRNDNIVTISGPEGAVLKYWFNDDMNTAELYTAPVTLTENGKISCVAYTNDAVSATTDLAITGFIVDRGGLGEQILITPADAETIHFRGLSANGRFAVGFAGNDTSSKGFIWDLTSDKFTYQNTIYVNQLYGISNDGTAYGFQLNTTNFDSEPDDEDFTWGTCKDGSWTKQPKGMTVNGITTEGIIFGSFDGKPVAYNHATEEFTYYLYNGKQAAGALTASSANTAIMGGHVTVDGKKIPVIWNSPESAMTINASDATIEKLSPNGEWAIVGNNSRLNITTGKIDTFASSFNSSNTNLVPESLHAIGNDGTIFGTYDPSLYSPDNGIGLVRTNDGRWRTFVDWLHDEMHISKLYDENGVDILSKYDITSVAAVSANQDIFLLHAFLKGASTDDHFTNGLILRINVPVNHLAPVDLNAEQMSGLNVIKVTWAAPLMGSEGIVSYTVHRDGKELATTSDKIYYDNDTEPNTTYTYTVTATYADGSVSDPSYATSISYSLDKYRPIRNIATRRIGYNDLSLTWAAPVTSIPKLQYFNEESDWEAFGTGLYNAEFGIRIPSSDIAPYVGKQIRTFQFLPSGPQQGFQLNLYHGNSDGNYEAQPFYTQAIEPSTLNYGTVNTITLDTPQELPMDGDLYVGLYVKSAENYDMLGISYLGFKGGYSDLCRIEGIHDHMISIAATSQSTTEIVLPLGLGISDESGYYGNIVKNYEITDNGGEPIATTSTKLKYTDVSEGSHRYAVTAVYSDGTKSNPTSIDVEVTNNINALTPVENVNATVNANNTVSLTWDTPRDLDYTYLHWGNMTPKPGWMLPEGTYTYIAKSIYPVTMTAPYAEDYEITHVYFCPIEDAGFEITLTNDENEILTTIDPEDLEFGEINYIELDEPITIEQSVNYHLNIDVLDGWKGCIPLAYDSSNKWHDQYSNLINFGTGMTTLSEVSLASERPNWLMGMVIRQKNARELPVAGYDVRVDGVKLNTEPVNDNEYTTPVLSKGLHEISIDAIYDKNYKVKGNVNDVIITTDAVEEPKTSLMYFPGNGTYIVGMPSTLTPVVTEPTMVTQAYKSKFTLQGNVDVAAAKLGSKSVILSQYISGDATVLDLKRYMGVGNISGLTIRSLDGNKYEIGDNAPTKTWTTSHLIAAYPKWKDNATLPIGVYDHWDCPLTYDKDQKFADGAYDAITVDFGNPHEGLVVKNVNFPLVTPLFANRNKSLRVVLSIYNDERTEVIDSYTVDVNLATAKQAKKTLSTATYSVVAELPKPVVINTPFEVTVSGFATNSVDGWLPRAVDATGYYPKHTTYSKTSTDSQVSEQSSLTDDVCLNVEGYFNYIGTWNLADGKTERGEVVGAGDYVQIYISPDDPDWNGSYFQGDPTFPVECTFGADNIIVESKPDWISEVEKDTSHWNEYGAVLLILTADGLPEGVSGRMDKIVFATADGASRYTIFIRQGDATFGSGILSPTIDIASDGGMYDLAGRRITAPDARVYIKGGKKILK